jgi:hypothetical protein
MWIFGLKMRRWVLASALLTGCGVAIVIFEGCLAIYEPGDSSDISGFFTGAGIGFIGAGLLTQALLNIRGRFPSGTPGSEVAGLRRKAIGYLVGGALLPCVLLTFGGLAMAGSISYALSVGVMWICFFGFLALLATAGHVKREALQITRRQERSLS